MREDETHTRGKSTGSEADSRLICGTNKNIPRFFLGINVCRGASETTQSGTISHFQPNQHGNSPPQDTARGQVLLI